MIFDITVTLEDATVEATATNDIAVTVTLDDEVINPQETFCERVDECLDIPTADGEYLLTITNGVISWEESSASGANIYNSDGTLTGDRTVNVDDNLLEFTTAYGHNLIFTDDFLGLGYNFAGEYHNDSGVIYANGIIDFGGVEYASLAVIDGVNNTNSFTQSSPTQASLGFIPNSSNPLRANVVITKEDYTEIIAHDSDATKEILNLSHANGDGTSTRVAGVYRDGAMSTDSGFYIGDKTTDGSWRFVTSGADLVIQKRESGNWITKQTII
jgi:hypothetical protein